jgi:hypothetical protein
MRNFKLKSMEQVGKDYYDLRNEEFFKFLNELFSINKSKTWDEIAQRVTLEKIKRTYRKFADLFPRKIDYLAELEKSKSSFTSIHFGEIKATRIIDEIVRFSLYSDKIIVFHPLQNPSVTNQNINPGNNPKYWLQDFLDSLYFYIVIQKWANCGIVKLIINPYEYDFKLRESIDQQVEKRIASSDRDNFYKIASGSVRDHMAEQFAIIYQYRNKDYIINSLLEMDSPRFTTSESEDFAERIIRAIPKINPLYKKLSIPINGKMLQVSKAGGPLESILLVSEKSGGNIYTPSELNWLQINQFGLNDFWVKANKLYSKIPLKFLNEVDTNFALELRQQDRLAGVRGQLKKIYAELNNLNFEKLTESKIRDLQDGFIEEVKKAESEWMDIKKQAELSRKYWLASSVGLPLITNEISVLPLAIGSIAWLINSESTTRQKESIQRQKNPISVFVDLKNQRQNYFSIYKNCLL